MRVPLQTQMVLPLAAVALTSLLAVGVINARIASRQTQARIEAQLQGVVRVLVTSNFPLTESVLQQMKSLSGADFVLVRESGQEIATSPFANAANLPADNIVDDLRKLELGSQITLADERYFHNGIHLRKRLGSFEAGVLHVLFPVEGYQAAWWSAFLPPLVIGVLAVLAVAIVAHLLARRMSKTMAQLGVGVARLAEGGFSPVETPTRDDELRDLVVAINQTADRLQQYEQEVRRTEQVRTLGLLGAGIAHEIRNAATGCRLALDLHAESCSTVSDDDGLVVAKTQLQLMESRLQRFLRLGQTAEEQTPVKIELGELVESVLSLVRPAAKHAGVEIGWQHPETPHWVTAQQESLELAVINLLLNAIEASTRGEQPAVKPTCVQLEINADAEWVRLQISDTGPGPSENIARRLFEPFVTSKQEGVGLGLAVVEQVATAHGGTIEWSRTDDVTQFTLRLPKKARSVSGE